MDRGTWQAPVHGVVKSWTRLKRLSAQLIYSVLISTVQQSGSVIHICTFLFIFFSIMIYHKTLNIVPFAIQRRASLVAQR